MTEDITPPSENKEEPSRVDVAQLRYSEYLVPFSEHIYKNYKPIEENVFRTFCTWPGTEHDLTPQIFREEAIHQNGVPPVLTQEEADSLSEKRKSQYVSKLVLSVNNSPEAAISSAKDTYQRLKEKKSTDELENWKKQRGSIVVEIKSDSAVGLISEFSNNHANLLLYEGVELESIINKTCSPIYFDYEEGND